MGLISLPVMMRYKYNMRYATGVLVASGTITQLIPPSLVLIVLADQLGRSVGDMYLGAWGPSLVQILLFALFTFAISVFKPEWVPAVPKSDLTLHGWELWKKCLWGIVPSAVLIFLVLGTLFMGLATPTEAGAMGAVGAIVIAVLRHPELGRTGKRMFAGRHSSRGGVAAIIGIYAFKSLPFKVGIAVLYLALAYLVIRAAVIPDLRALSSAPTRRRCASPRW